MEHLLLSVLVAAITSAVTAFLGHLFFLKRIRAETNQHVHKEFIERQLTAYMRFWTLLAPTSPHSPRRLIRGEKTDLPELNTSMTKEFIDSTVTFFFSEHGIFLSQRLRKVLFGTREILQTLLESHSDQEWVPISKTKCKAITGGFLYLIIYCRDDLGLKDPEFLKSRLPDATA